MWWNGVLWSGVWWSGVWWHVVEWCKVCGGRKDGSFER